jgi:hypothetical protein
MDKDTILFVRKNQYALAFHWDFFRNTPGLVSKYFTKNPPIAVYFKAGEDFDSWVDYKLAVEDGKWVNITDPVRACEDAYEKGNRLVKNLNVDIPNTIYIDADGYEYYIPINDGTIHPVYRTKMTVGNPLLSDVGASQFSVYNSSLPFSQRHMMDDLKLEFKENGLRENNITTFNMLMMPLLFDEADPKIAYIRNALRMSSYQAFESESEEFSIPLSPLISSAIKYIPHGIFDPSKGKQNKFFMAFWGTLYCISSDNKLRQTEDLVNLTWNEITVPPLLSASRNRPTDSRSDEVLASIYPKQTLIVAPGPTENMLFAYDAECFKNGAPESYNQYAVSYDNGAHWAKNFYDKVLTDTHSGNSIPPLQAANQTIIEDSVGSITIGQMVKDIYFMYIPYPKSPNLMMFALANDLGLVECYTTVNGASWTKVPLPDDIPFDITPNDTIQYHLTLFKKNFFSPKTIGDMYIDKNNAIHYKISDTQWKDTTITTDDIENNLRSYFFANSNLEQRTDLADVDLTVVYHYDRENGVIHAGYYAFAFSLAQQLPGAPESSYDRRKTIEVFQESGSVDIRISETTPGTFSAMCFNFRHTHKTVQDVAAETGQFNNDTIHGDYMVFFNPDDVYYVDGKWIIRDTLSSMNAGDPKHELVSNLDRQHGFMFRISEDFIHWFPVRGINGQTLPNSDTAHVYADITSLKGIAFILQDDRAITYTVPRKGAWHYALRTNIHKWYGIKLSQQIKATYIADASKQHVFDTDEPPIKIGFPFALNPDATILLYNGYPILDGSAYVNPENNKEILVSNMVEKYMIQQIILPIKYRKDNRKYVAEDFAVIVASAVDPDKNVHAFIAPGRAVSFGKEVSVDFNTNLSGDLILFNGIDHEYEITGKKSIKYIFSRYGISETIYDFMKYNTSGYANYLTKGNQVYRLQFLLSPKK